MMTDLGRNTRGGWVARALIAGAALLVFVAAADDATMRVRAWRTQHETQILHELFDLLAIPNVATDAADIRRNADALVTMFERRHFTGDMVATKGAPLVLMERRAPSASSGRSRSIFTTTASRSCHPSGLTSPRSRP